MQIFIDTCNLEEIKASMNMQIIDGVTTTPTFAAKEKINYNSDFIRATREIIGKEKDIYYTIASSDYDEIVQVASDIFEESDRDRHLIMKLSTSYDSLRATHKLNKMGIRTGMHLVYTVNQALLATKSKAECLFPLLGRSDDIGGNGIILARNILTAFKNNNSDIKIIGASIRHPLHVSELFKMGAYGATVSLSVLLKLIEHPLTRDGIKVFRADYLKSKEYK